MIQIRLDGRGLEAVRPLDMEVDFCLHRMVLHCLQGGKHNHLTTVTLGTPLDELLIESAAISDYSKFILHYNFPPFSTGEVKMMRGAGTQRSWTW